jgi:prepilin-type N-terminal cleavage/methylation domain-containing protein/prepilin-type processing-associated H-X9-DG protein
MLVNFQGMRVTRSTSSPKAFTLIELLCVMAFIGVLASLLLPAINQGRARAQRVACINNLRQVGVAFQSFAHDHNGRFPMNVPAAAGGSQEFTLTSYQVAGEFFFSFRHFQALSNDLVAPRLLICPADTRLPATNFAALKNENLSYFANLKADYSRPNSLLAGDRNLTNDYEAGATLARLANIRAWRWTSELHRFKGNVLFSDGHVEETSGRALAATFNQTQLTVDLTFPTTILRTASAGQSPANILPAMRGDDAGRSGDISPSPGTQSPPNAKSPANTPNQTQREASTRRASPQELSTLPDAGAQVSANSKTNPPEPQKANGRPGNPIREQEPGFSFFPPSLGIAVHHLVKESSWIFYLLLLLIAGDALWLRIRANQSKAGTGKASLGK